jgi:hypothetical protein
MAVSDDLSNAIRNKMGGEAGDGMQGFANRGPQMVRGRD